MAQNCRRVLFLQRKVRKNVLILKRQMVKAQSHKKLLQKPCTYNECIILSGYLAVVFLLWSVLRFFTSEQHGLNFVFFKFFD